MTNILITGCSSGIGLHTAKILQDNNIKVYATARNSKDVDILKNMGFEAYFLDVLKPETIQEVLKIILEKDNKLDAVFNNAGYGQIGAIEDIKTDVLVEQFNTNVFGLHELTIQALKIMRTQGYGKIIQHSSVLGLISLKFRGAYNASKYAIEGLSDTLRQELQGSDIFLSTINTGPVTSHFRQNALKNFNKNVDIKNSFFIDTYNKQQKDRLTNKDDTIFTLPASSVSGVVLKILQSNKPKPRYYVTKATTILGFFKRVLSTSLLDKLLNKI